MNSPDTSVGTSLHKRENIKHLHERWRTFSFYPNIDDIEEYIRDVHKAAKHLGHGDDVVLNLLKATMPTELYGTLYGHDNLYIIMTMLKDIYAKKPQLTAAAAADTAAQGATAPFTITCTPTRIPPKAQDKSSLEERIAQLTETLYQKDLHGKPVKKPFKPFKPFITQPRRRFKGGFDRGCNRHGAHFDHPDGRDCHGRYQGNRGCFKSQRPFGKFDKGPNTKHPRVSGRPFNKDKICCYKCEEFGHMQKDCPELHKPYKEDNPGPKRFEDYTYTYSGPNVQSQMQINSVNPNLTRAYDQV